MTRSARLLLLALPGLMMLADTPELGFAKANLDPSVQPKEDFYLYATGGWKKHTPFPADRSRYGAMEEVAEMTAKTLQTLFAELGTRKDLKPGSIEQQVADFYASGMHEEGIEKAGLTPLAPYLAQIKGIQPATAAAGLAQWHNQGFPALFRVSVDQDAKRSTRYLAQLSQGGLGLPDRDYYLKDDPRSVQLRAKYLAHVGEMLILSGLEDAQAQGIAKGILELETRLAKASLSLTELRDPQKRYNLKTMDQIQALTPGFDWKAYFAGRNMAVSEANVAQPTFFEALPAILQATPADVLQGYLQWHLVNQRAQALPRAIRQANFTFFEQTLNGVPQAAPRWKVVQTAVDMGIPHSLGQLYVRKAFSPSAKARIKTLVEHLRAAYGQRIQALPWMSKETKALALKKLQAFGVKVGYPDAWKTYTFPIKTDDFFGNVQRAAEARNLEMRQRLGKPVDRGEWGMTPATVNAYYSASNNEIVFPAAILQPPFFDPKADDAVNYGAIGVVIGHEMSHGFDDSGSQYDAEGNLANWWTPADRKAYLDRTELMVNQYDAYEPLPGEHINGKMTLGENISDLGGLKAAYAAYQRSLKGAKPPVIAGITGPQRFYIGYAQIWRQHIRDAALSVRLKTDVHSPGHWRVIGPLANLPDFHQAFGIKAGDPMFRAEALRPDIW